VKGWWHGGAGVSDLAATDPAGSPAGQAARAPRPGIDSADPAADPLGDPAVAPPPAPTLGP